MSEEHHELGAFIRRHRAKITPQQAGLGVSGRRRTAGLRREELALLVNASSTWITWIEQGRSVQPSTAMLDRLSTVLQLSSAERQYLFNLAGKADPHGENRFTEIPPALLRIIEKQDTPTYLLDRYWNAIAWNDAAAAHFLDWLSGFESAGEKHPNLLEFILLHPAAKRFVEDWESRSRRIVAEFRADVGKHLDDPEMIRRIQQLHQQSAFFTELWSAQDVVEREGGRRIFQHPGRGRVVYEQSTLLPAAHTDMKLVMLLPVTR